VERQPKEDVGSTPPSRSKNPKNHTGFFVTNYLYPTGAGIGLVGELFCLLFSSIFFLPWLPTILAAHHNLIKGRLDFHYLPQLLVDDGSHVDKGYMANDAQVLFHQHLP
jgi:hypothetical protein